MTKSTEDPKVEQYGQGIALLTFLVDFLEARVSYGASGDNKFSHYYRLFYYWPCEFYMGAKLERMR